MNLPPLDALLRQFAELVAELVVDKMRAGVSPEYYDQSTSPLGPRKHCAAIRNGRLPGTRLGERWLARRQDVDVYISELGSKARLRTPGREEQLAAELGLVLVAGGKR